MTTGLFTFEDALHTHSTIGNVEACPACAQTRCDMALSAAAYHAKHEAGQAAPILVRVPVLVTGRAKSRVSGNVSPTSRNHKSRSTGTLSSVA